MKKLRTNSKEVREKIKVHLIEISQNDYIEVETVEQAIKYIINKFYNEKIKHNKHYTNNIKIISYQEIFFNWLNGLPLDTYYTSTDIEEYLSCLNVNYKKHKPEDTYYYLIFKEIQKDLFELIERRN